MQPDRVVLAFDFGMIHIGLAVGQTVTRTATPLTTLRAKKGCPRWQEVSALLQEWQPDLLIVGLPLNMDDSESDMSSHARKFAERLRGRFGLPVELSDERLTSFEARLHEATDTHAGAACLIAESWLSET